MEKHPSPPPFILSTLIALGLFSFLLCIAAEFTRTKKKDLRLDGKLCYLPGSHAFGLGIAAILCLLISQIIGSFIICNHFCSGAKRATSKSRKPMLLINFAILSWLCFGVAVIIIGAATSMNRRQAYEEGWLDGECYIAKDGVYVVSAMLVLASVGLTLCSAIITVRKSQLEQGQKVHAQI